MEPWWGNVDNYGDKSTDVWITPKTFVLLGEYKHTVDEKGRVAVPSKFRKFLVEGLVLTRGMENCLYLYPPAEWAAFADKVSKLPINQADARAFSRLMLGGAASAEIDNQGRVLIPDYLRKYAGIGSRVVIVGLNNRAEIWDEAKWEEYRASAEGRADEIAERLGGISA